MNSWNLSQLVPWMLESGRLSLSYFDHPAMEFKADHSIVTAADRRVEAFWTERLNQPNEGSFLLGEETIAQQTEDFLEQAFRETAWIIDPIDGTAPFANGLPTWGVSLGLMQKGVLKEGIVLLPVLGELYYTKDGFTFREKLGSNPEEWTKNLGNPVRLEQPEFKFLPPGSMISISQQLARQGRYRLPYYVQATGSAVFGMVRLAAGSYGALVTRFKLWDFAACVPMLANLGWTIVLHNDGKPFGLVMDDSNLIRKAGDPERWSTHDHIVFAPSIEAAAEIRAQTFFDGE